MAAERSSNPRTKPATMKAPNPRNDDGLKTCQYEATKEGQPPITISPPHRAPPANTHPALRVDENLTKRDSGLAPTTFTTTRHGSDVTMPESISSIQRSSSPLAIPQAASMTNIKDRESSAGSGKLRKSSAETTKRRTSKATDSTNINKASSLHRDFSPLMIPVPCDAHSGMDFMESLTFSNRGSVLLGGKKAVNEQLHPIANTRLAFAMSFNQRRTNNF